MTANLWLGLLELVLSLVMSPIAILDGFERAYMVARPAMSAIFSPLGLPIYLYIMCRAFFFTHTARCTCIRGMEKFGRHKKWMEEWAYDVGLQVGKCSFMTIEFAHLNALCQLIGYEFNPFLCILNLHVFQVFVIYIKARQANICIRHGDGISCHTLPSTFWYGFGKDFARLTGVVSTCTYKI